MEQCGFCTVDEMVYKLFFTNVGFYNIGLNYAGAHFNIGIDVGIDIEASAYDLGSILWSNHEKGALLVRFYIKETFSLYFYDSEIFGLPLRIGKRTVAVEQDSRAVRQCHFLSNPMGCGKDRKSTRLNSSHVKI